MTRLRPASRFALLLAVATAGCSLTSSGATKEESFGMGSWQGARTSRDPRQLVVAIVGGPEYDLANPCSKRYLGVAEETHAQVIVRIRSQGPPNPPQQLACTMEGHSRTATVQLDRPLGLRALVVAPLVGVQPVFPGETLLEPPWLPDGWRVGADGAGYPDPEKARYWSRSWAPPEPTARTDCTPDRVAGVSLTQGPADVVGRSAVGGERSQSQHDIGGSPAVYGVNETTGSARLAWVRGEQGFVVSSLPRCAGSAAASEATLVRFARGLG